MELNKRKTEFDKMKVFVIDSKKLSEKIDKEIKEEIKKAGDSEFTPQLYEGEFFKVYDFALVKSPSGKIFYIDNECIYSECEDGKVEIYIYSEIKDAEGKITSFGILPRFLSTIQAEDLIKDHAIEINMFNFIRRNFIYDSQIKRNMGILQELLKE